MLYEPGHALLTPSTCQPNGTNLALVALAASQSWHARLALERLQQSARAALALVALRAEKAGESGWARAAFGALGAPLALVAEGALLAGSARHANQSRLTFGFRFRVV